MYNTRVKAKMRENKRGDPKKNKKKRKPQFHTHRDCIFVPYMYKQVYEHKATLTYNQRLACRSKAVCIPDTQRSIEVLWAKETNKEKPKSLLEKQGRTREKERNIELPLKNSSTI